MIWEIFAAGLVFYIIFGDYIGAKADEIRERTRGIEIENDMKDAINHQDEQGGNHEEGV